MRHWLTVNCVQTYRLQHARGISDSALSLRVSRLTILSIVLLAAIKRSLNTLNFCDMLAAISIK